LLSPLSFRLCHFQPFYFSARLDLLAALRLQLHLLANIIAFDFLPFRHTELPFLDTLIFLSSAR